MIKGKRTVWKESLTVLLGSKGFSQQDLGYLLWIKDSLNLAMTSERGCGLSIMRGDENGTGTADPHSQQAFCVFLSLYQQPCRKTQEKNQFRVRKINHVRSILHSFL